MTKKLQVGDLVICKFYNTPDKRFYGEEWKAKILKINPDVYDYKPPRDFVVRDTLVGDIHTVWRKEIIRRIKS